MSDTQNTSSSVMAQRVAQTFLDGRVTLHPGDCLDVVRLMPACSVDAVVTDPPYALVSIGKRFGADNAAPCKAGKGPGKTGAYQRASAGFMGKRWDTGETAFAVEFWAEILRVVKPGGHVVAFGGTRSYHRLACAIEDAGFEIRDQFAWAYSTGFPKSHDVALDFETQLCERRDDKWFYKSDGAPLVRGVWRHPLAAEWGGWGTAVKPAWEPICIARKPLGTGDINVRRNVECELRRLGVTTEIVWEEESAETASSQKRRRKSSPVNAGSSAENASELEIARTEIGTETGSTLNIELGTPETDISISQPPEPDTTRPRTTSSTTMEGDVFAAEKQSRPSSPSTILMVEEPSTESQPATEFITTSSSEASHPTSESFAGIATGLSDSLAHVLIRREGSSFVWPVGLPTFVPSRPLNVAANVLRWGTGALNIDATRVETGDKPYSYPNGRGGEGWHGRESLSSNLAIPLSGSPLGRWPANLCHDGSDEVLALFPDAGGGYGKRGGNKNSTSYGFENGTMETVGYGDSGSAARFFYCAKASKKDRAGSKHPTVKPVDLMRWLVRLITPPGGTVLDPFAGTGSTGEAAFLEGVSAILIEREAEYLADISRRMAHVFAPPRIRKQTSVTARGRTGVAGPLFAADPADSKRNL